MTIQTRKAQIEIKERNETNTQTQTNPFQSTGPIDTQITLTRVSTMTFTKSAQCGLWHLPRASRFSPLPDDNKQSVDLTVTLPATTTQAGSPHLFSHQPASQLSPPAVSVVRLLCGQRVDDGDLAVLPPRLAPQVWPEVLYLLPHELLYDVLGHLVLLELEVELALALGLALDVVEGLEVRVSQRLVHADALVGVEHQHLVQQVQRQRVGILWMLTSKAKNKQQVSSKRDSADQSSTAGVRVVSGMCLCGRLTR